MKQIIIISFLCALIAGTTAAQTPAQLTSLPQEKKVTDVDKEPMPIFQKQPKYPASALKDLFEGTVWVGLMVDEQGRVESVRLIKGARGDLDTASLEAAKQWRFTPAEKKGKPVKTEVTIPFRFKVSTKSSYPLEETKGKLTTKDLDDALRFLGVGIARFTYEVPFKHRLNFSAEQFVQGKQQGTHPVMQSTMIPKSGKRAFTLLIHKKDQQLSIGMNADGILFTTSGILVKGYNVDGSTTLSDATLQEKTKMPFFVYVASKQGGINLDSKASVEELIAKYDFAVVFYVELEPF